MRISYSSPSTRSPSYFLKVKNLTSQMPPTICQTVLAVQEASYATIHVTSATDFLLLEYRWD